jgi:hypothetical protein
MAFGSESRTNVPELLRYDHFPLLIEYYYLDEIRARRVKVWKALERDQEPWVPVRPVDRIFVRVFLRSLIVLLVA